MDFNVKGITFNRSDLSKIKLSDLAVGTISRSHIFHLLPKGNTAVLLLRAGDFVELDFITKFESKGVESFDQLEVIQSDDILKYKNLWSRLKVCRSEKSQRLLRDEIIQEVANDYWVKSDKSFLSFTVSCFEEFYFLPESLLEVSQSKSMTLYTRSLLVSSVSIIASLSHGYTDFKFIKDFYNIAFIMDYGLINDDELDYAITHACELERATPNTGLTYLSSKKIFNTDKIKFQQHPFKSAEYANQFAELFHHPELIENIKFHHEKFDGSGFPEGYTFSSMSETQTLLNFCDQLVPFIEHIFIIGDGYEILNLNFHNIFKLSNSAILPINAVCSSWESMMSWGCEPIEDAS